MSLPKLRLTRELARELFWLESHLGFLYWRERPREHFPSLWKWAKFNAECSGTFVGTVKQDSRKWVPGNHSRLRASIKMPGFRSTSFRVCNIIWVYVNGEIPEGHIIDHINRIPYDDRPENLRLATIRQNNTNGAAYNKNGSTPFVGVYVDPKKKGPKRFKARGRDPQGRDRHIIYAASAENAAIARDIIAIEFNGEHALLNFPEIADLPRNLRLTRFRDLGGNPYLAAELEKLF